MSVLDRWREFRRAQRDALRASNHPHDLAEADGWPGELLAEILPSRRKPAEAAGTEGAGATEGDGDRADQVGPAAEPERDGQSDQSDDDRPDYGRAGRPLNRQSPFYMGFVGAVGVLTALLLWHTIGRLTTVLTLVVVAFFLALTLN